MDFQPFNFIQTLNNSPDFFQNSYIQVGCHAAPNLLVHAHNWDNVLQSFCITWYCKQIQQYIFDYMCLSLTKELDYEGASRGHATEARVLSSSSKLDHAVLNQTHFMRELTFIAIKKNVIILKLSQYMYTDISIHFSCVESIFLKYYIPAAFETFMLSCIQILCSTYYGIHLRINANLPPNMPMCLSNIGNSDHYKKTIFKNSKEIFDLFFHDNLLSIMKKKIVQIQAFKPL